MNTWRYLLPGRRWVRTLTAPPRRAISAFGIASMVASALVARFELKAGAQVDLLTDEELGRQLDRWQRGLEQYLHERQGTIRVFTGAQVPTDSNGNAITGPDGGGYGVYRVPEGFVAYLVRLVATSPTIEAQVTNPSINGVLYFYADQATPSSFRGWDPSGSFPVQYESSRSHAPMFRGGQKLVVTIRGLSISSSAIEENVAVSVQVILVRHSSIKEGDPV